MTRNRLPVFVALTALLFAGGLAPLQLDAQYAGFGKNKVQYEDFEWQIYHSPHFDVYYYTAEEDLLKKVVSFAESAYDELSRLFDYQIQDPTPLIFYETHAAFEQNNIILNFIPESTGAFATPARTRMVMPVDLPDRELMGLMRHELTHIFQYHLLFGGSLGKAAASRPPLWFTEGMASYVAQDEEEYDRMVLRDAVVNDQIPSLAQGANPGGYFSYRIGHAAFDYIEERWGREGIIDLLYEVRNTLGARVGRAIERTFRIDPEDFDLDFRRWLRRKYLQVLVETGEPSDFGRPFRVTDNPNTVESSPVASPSGDLVAAISVQRSDIDIVLFDAQTRRQIRSLTRGFTTEYRYLVSQQFLVGRRMGRDLDFSPDGNYLVAFARQDGSRNLLFFDVLNGGLDRVIELPEVAQPLAPAFSPDGRHVAFSANKNGRFDLFMVDIESEELIQLTDDEIYEGAPVFAPDGKSLVYSTEDGDYYKLYRLSLDDPSQRSQITTGESNEKDAVFSPDGKTLYFASDRNGFNNIYGLELETGRLTQYTDVVTGTFMPTVLREPDGGETLVYGGLWNRRYRLYRTDLDAPIGDPETMEVPEQKGEPAEVERFQPAIEVAIDEANVDNYGGFKFFLENAATNVSVDDDQLFLGQILLSFSDYLGDHRIIAVLSSYDSLSNFDITYADLSDRLQWNINLFDYRDFYQLVRDNTGRVLDRRGEVRITGAAASITYPFSFNTRAEAGVGYVFRKYSVPIGVDPVFGLVDFSTIEDDYPFVRAGLVGDTTSFAPWGPVAGRRWRFDADYSPDTEGSGTLTSRVTADYRQYFPVTQRSNVAVRAFGGAALGNNPTLFYFGTREIRSFGLRTLVGDRAGFVNVEYRFPVIDLLATPVFAFQSIRGRIFLDVGAVWNEKIAILAPDGQIVRVENPVDFEFWDSDESRLQDGLAAYGFGFTINFLGLDLNWDFAKRWDLDSTQSDFITTFYIGYQF